MQPNHWCIKHQRSAPWASRSQQVLERRPERPLGAWSRAPSFLGWGLFPTVRVCNGFVVWRGNPFLSSRPQTQGVRQAIVLFWENIHPRCNNIREIARERKTALGDMYVKLIKFAILLYWSISDLCANPTKYPHMQDYHLVFQDLMSCAFI